MPSPAPKAPDQPPPQAVGTSGALAALPPEWRTAIEDFIVVRVAEEVAKLDAKVPATLSIQEAIPLMQPGQRSESSVRRGIKRGTLLARKNGSRWVLDRDDVLAAGRKQTEAVSRVEQILHAFGGRKGAKYGGKLARISRKSADQV